MMLYLQEVATCSVRIFLDYDSVTRFEPWRLDEIVRVGFIWTPAVTRVRFDLCLFRLSIPNESETLPLSREER